MGASFNVCVICDFKCEALGALQPAYGPIDANNCTLPSSPSPTVTTPSPSANVSTPVPSGSGELLTFEFCFLQDVDVCAAPRKCSNFEKSLNDGIPVPCSREAQSCVCFPPSLTSCSNSGVCSDGERCLKLNNGTASLSVCASCNNIPVSYTHLTLPTTSRV